MNKTVEVPGAPVDVRWRAPTTTSMMMFDTIGGYEPLLSNEGGRFYITFDREWCGMFLPLSRDRNSSLHHPGASGAVVQGLGLAAAVSAVVSLVAPGYAMRDFTLHVKYFVPIDATVTIEVVCRRMRYNRVASFATFFVRMLNTSGEDVLPGQDFTVFKISRGN